jgi:hypothetical protein
MSSARLVAALAVGAITALFAFYGAYFVRTLAPLNSELALLDAAAPSAYGVILQAWSLIAGDGLAAARLLSLLAAVASLVLLVRILHRLSGDGVLAAFAALAFVLFPPLVATQSSATPHALIVLSALAALDTLLSAEPPVARGLLAGVLVALTLLLSPLAVVLMPLWLALCAVISRNTTAAGVAAVAAFCAAVLFWALSVPVPVIDLDLSPAGQHGAFKALVVPYAMVPTLMLLSALALCSGRVHTAVGLARGLALVIAPAVVVAALLAARAMGAIDTGQLLTAFASAAPFFLLTSWPLIAWMRTVMPGVKSILAWIVFPVVMYSCFWVILGPIDRDKFPYSHLRALQPGVSP